MSMSDPSAVNCRFVCDKGHITLATGEIHWLLRCGTCSGTISTSPGIEALCSRIERLEAENSDLRATDTRLRETMVRYEGMLRKFEKQP
jgi:hypothetical protein